MATSLLKFSLKTSLVKSIISEISSNIGKYFYAFGKSDPWFTIKGLSATLTEGSIEVVLTNGTTDGFLVGQLVTQTGGAGAFDGASRISSIIDNVTFEVTESHVTSGDVTFTIDDESVIESVSDLFEYETKTRNYLTLYKQIDSNDVAPIIKRFNWAQGYVYDMYREYTDSDPAYSGATTIDAAEFYVLTDQFNVYKCLDNNNNSPSFFKPTGTSPNPITLDDSYIWKYMYTIPVSMRNKFLSTTTMPVVTALTNQFYSKGSIVGYSIENSGEGMSSASYKVVGFKIYDGGTNYSGTPTISIEAAHQPAGTNAVVDTITMVNGKITNITMSNEGSGYSYPPVFTLTGTADVQAVIEPIIENTGLSYVNLLVSGDGRLEENPFVIDSIDVLDGGSGYDSITLLFTNPDLPYGVKASATVTIVDGVATEITVDEQGYGYSLPFYSVNDDSLASNIVRYEQTNIADPGAPGYTGSPGIGFKFRVNFKKNEAEIAAVLNSQGQVESVKVIKPGIGYTYASVNVDVDGDTLYGNPDYVEPSILLDFGVGNIESNQSTVEITAIPGAVYAIYIKNAGSGYTTVPNIRIEGDGTGATAEVVLSPYNTIQKINIITPGYGYTYASAILEDEFGQTPVSLEEAVLDVILPPQGGHGKDAISELYSKSVIFQTVLFNDRIFSKAIANNFRQICLVKNPKIYGKDISVRFGIGSSAELVLGSNTQTADFNQIFVSDILTDSSGNRYLVDAKYLNYDDNNHALMLTYLDNVVLGAGNTIGKTGVNFSISSVIEPAINKFSGEILTIDNRVKFAPTSEQIVVASNIISF